MFFSNNSDTHTTKNGKLKKDQKQRNGKTDVDATPRSIWRKARNSIPPIAKTFAFNILLVGT
jgi:hypothetical protein